MTGHPVTVTTEEITRLRARHLSLEKIAAIVGITRQAVGYRLKPRDRRLPVPLLHERVAIPTPTRCGECRRFLTGKDARGARSVLPEPEWCRWCARALTP